MAESLRLGGVIEGVSFVVRKLERVDAGLGEQPPHWTLLWFEGDDRDADWVAAMLSDALDRVGGWYTDFHSNSEVAVVFCGRMFRYRRGDRVERARVEEYARSVGVPAAQLDRAKQARPRRFGGPHR